MIAIMFSLDPCSEKHNEMLISLTKLLVAFYLPLTSQSASYKSMNATKIELTPSALTSRESSLSEMMNTTNLANNSQIFMSSQLLNDVNINCGIVPLYEKYNQLGINETFNLGRRREIDAFHRVLHGIDAITGEWPWIAKIELCDSFGCRYCTGTLLNTRWVITAGHCSDSKIPLSMYKVTFGLYDLIEPDERSFSVSVDKMIQHPEYDNDLNNDISLIRLSEEVEFNDFIQPACLIERVASVLQYTKDKLCYTVGYGLLVDGLEPTRLQKLKVRIQEPSRCNSNKHNGVQLTRGAVCMGPKKIGASCVGDSGGPNICYDCTLNQWVLVATVSFGPDNCDRDQSDAWLTVSVDLTNFRAWIINTILTNS